MSSGLLRAFGTIGLALMLGASLSACAGMPLIGGTSWKEEVLLHDGSKIIVKRWAERGGYHAIGQQPAFKEQSLSFTLPGTNEHVTWKNGYSKEVGFADLKPLLLDVSSGSAYLVTTPVGCLSYNKWDRPNPPYVVFRYQGGEWKQIPVQELPAKMKVANVIISSPDNEVEMLRRKNKISGSYVTADLIQEVNREISTSYYMFRRIFREPLPGNMGCGERIKYKGYWIIPGDTVAKTIIDRNKK
jgi:hypothetical protein